MDHSAYSSLSVGLPLCWNDCSKNNTPGKGGVAFFSHCLGGNPWPSLIAFALQSLL